MDDRSTRIRSLLVATAIAVASSAVLAAQAHSSDTGPSSTDPSCTRDCRGLGIEKVKAGEEHCGLVSPERKAEALAAACGLAESHHDELQKLAEERAVAKCAAERDSPSCRRHTKHTESRNKTIQSK